jgi:hypothetical protein
VLVTNLPPHPIGDNPTRVRGVLFPDYRLLTAGWFFSSLSIFAGESVFCPVYQSLIFSLIFSGSLFSWSGIFPP